MAKTKIKADSHGLYIRFDCKIYRPVETQFSYPIIHEGGWTYGATGGQSVFAVGDQVYVALRKQSPFCRIKQGDKLEYWHEHGWYFKGDEIIDSELLWRPKL